MFCKMTDLPNPQKDPSLIKHGNAKSEKKEMIFQEKMVCVFGLSSFSSAVQVSCFCAFATAGAAYGITSAAGKATLALFAECLFLVGGFSFKPLKTMNVDGDHHMSSYPHTR